MQAKSAAFVVHKTSHRIRIKIPARQGQNTYYSELQLRLAAHSKVDAVETNPLVGSIVIHCRPGFDLVALHQLSGLDLIVVDAPANSAVRQFAPGGVYRVSDDSLAFARSIFKLAIAIATRQLGAQLMEWLIEAGVRALLAKLIPPPAHRPLIAPTPIPCLEAAD